VGPRPRHASPLGCDRRGRGVVDDLTQVRGHERAGQRGVGERNGLGGFAEVHRDEIRRAGGVREDRDARVAQQVGGGGHRPVTARRDDAVEVLGVEERPFEPALGCQRPDDDLGAPADKLADVLVQAGLALAGPRVVRDEDSHVRPPNSIHDAGPVV
jgi:hypothetical protein